MAQWTAPASELDLLRTGIEDAQRLVDKVSLMGSVERASRSGTIAEELVPVRGRRCTAVCPACEEPFCISSFPAPAVLL
jgi:hypothetical protein